MAGAPERDVSRLLFVGTQGWVTAVDKFTGHEIWRTSLPSTGWTIVTLLHEDGVLYAASQGHVFALNPANGDVAWSNALPKLGNGHCCLATVRSSTDPNSAPIAQVAAAEAAARQSSHTTTT
jgi:outer membrane protein assembly factor BamB